MDVAYPQNADVCLRLSVTAVLNCWPQLLYPADEFIHHCEGWRCGLFPDYFGQSCWRITTVWNSFIYVWTTMVVCPTTMECPTTTRSERALSPRFPPRTEDRSVPVVVPCCGALSARPSLSAVNVTMYWLLQTDSVNTVPWSCSSNAIMAP